MAAVAAPGLLSAVVIDIQGGISPTTLEPGAELRGAKRRASSRPVLGRRKPS